MISILHQTLGSVGITLNIDWYEPYNSTDESHVEAAETKLQFHLGWFANPIYVNGQYPDVMRQKVFSELKQCFPEI